MENKHAVAARPRATLATRLRKMALAGALALSSVTALAGYVTTNESAMDLIFAQSSFGANAIDIRYNSALTLNNPGLLDIGTETEFESLGILVPVPQNTVLAFFVNTISWCGGAGGGIIGCGGRPGSFFAVNSSWAASATYGGPLVAHELSHNLGLEHVADESNLMNAVLLGNTALSASQVTTILASPLVQTDGLGQRFILITPVAVVPEPEIALMLALGLFTLVADGYRRRRSMAST